MSEGLLIAIIGALVPAIGAGIFALWQTKRSANVAADAARVAADAQKHIASIENLQKFCDQLQEQLEAEQAARREDAARNRTEILELRADVASALRGVRKRDAYISLLRRHIDDGLPPPPPAYPDDMD